MQRLIKSACAIAAEDIGTERAARIAQNAQNRYEALCAENAGEPKALKIHSFRRIYPGVAVYETMRADGIEADRAVWYIREYFQRFSAKAVPHIQRLIRFTGAAKKIPGLFLKISVRNFGEDAGFIYEFPASSGNEARFNIVKCPYYDTCKRYGCTEIVKAFCDGDDAGDGDLHPRLHWGRTKTIGRGGDCCDFLLEYKE